jgi:hypothetical protein
MRNRLHGRCSEAQRYIFLSFCVCILNYDPPCNFRLNNQGKMTPALRNFKENMLVLQETSKRHFEQRDFTSSLTSVHVKPNKLEFRDVK